MLLIICACVTNANALFVGYEEGTLTHYRLTLTRGTSGPNQSYCLPEHASASKAHHRNTLKAVWKEDIF